MSLPGTLLLTREGKVVTIIFQSAASGKIAYAIPAEAVHRVLRDFGQGGPLVRGWLGLALRAENQTAQVARVLPNSPAASAGLLAGDILTNIGERKISDYADSANAFFYPIPGAPVRMQLLRGAEPLEFSLTPAPPGGI